ncbi:MAG: hypothetical protein VR64_16925 [Desulfatitalea sp. BRH_c12]|nr:MAG: hypothetical protein VR64_16925 [Desulfatitalea sp. BRH_c12]
MTYAPDVTAAMIKMVLSLAVVLALLWGLQRWVRHARPGGVGGRERLITVLGNHYLGPKKSIALVKVPGTVLVVGIGTEQITLLTRIDDPVVLADLAVSAETAGGAGFREQLQRMIQPLSQKFTPADTLGKADESRKR